MYFSALNTRYFIKNGGGLMEKVGQFCIYVQGNICFFLFPIENYWVDFIYNHRFCCGLMKSAKKVLEKMKNILDT